MSTASAKTFVRDSNRVANGSTGIAIIAGYFSLGTGTALFGLNAAYYYNLANYVGYRNSGHSRGIILNWTWAGPYWTEKQ